MISAELYIDPRQVADYLNGRKIQAWTAEYGYAANMKIIVPVYEIASTFGGSIYIRKNGTEAVGV